MVQEIDINKAEFTVHSFIHQLKESIGKIQSISQPQSFKKNQDRYESSKNYFLSGYTIPLQGLNDTDVAGKQQELAGATVQAQHCKNELLRIRTDLDYTKNLWKSRLDIIHQEQGQAYHVPGIASEYHKIEQYSDVQIRKIEKLIWEIDTALQNAGSISPTDLGLERKISDPIRLSSVRQPAYRDNRLLYETLNRLEYRTSPHRGLYIVRPHLDPHSQKQDENLVQKIDRGGGIYLPNPVKLYDPIPLENYLRKIKLNYFFNESGDPYVSSNRYA